MANIDIIQPVFSFPHFRLSLHRSPDHQWNAIYSLFPPKFMNIINKRKKINKRVPHKLSVLPQKS